jgi:hypothetical protein
VRKKPFQKCCPQEEISRKTAHAPRPQQLSPSNSSKLVIRWLPPSPLDRPNHHHHTHRPTQTIVPFPNLRTAMAEVNYEDPPLDLPFSSSLNDSFGWNSDNDEPMPRR